MNLKPIRNRAYFPGDFTPRISYKNANFSRSFTVLQLNWRRSCRAYGAKKPPVCDLASWGLPCSDAQHPKGYFWPQLTDDKYRGCSINLESRLDLAAKCPQIFFQQAVPVEGVDAHNQGDSLGSLQLLAWSARAFTPFRDSIEDQNP